jgi:hypothetical protein
LFVAVALASLLWSCESEQTGYAVTIPLIGPMEFDETSCEFSGDICSTDDDCFDEDGFNVGPCTKTMENLEPITVQVSLSPSSPSYTLGVVDTGPWTGILASQRLAAEKGLEGIRIDMTMDNFSIQGGPVLIVVDIFSRVGLIAGRPATYDPVERPGSCEFVLNDESVGQDYADNINTCLSDWISLHGAPVEFDMRVTSSAATASSLAAKSGFVTKQLDDYNLMGFYGMSTNKDCDTERAKDVLDPIREGEGFFAELTCENLTLTGTGNTAQDLDEIYGYADVWDRCGNWASAVLLKTSLSAGPFEVRVLESGAVESGVVPIVFSPSGVNFTQALVGAATGGCLSDAPNVIPILPEGAAYAGWHHCGPTPPPDRTGSITVSTGGFCSVAGDSGSDGGVPPDGGLDGGLDGGVPPDGGLDGGLDGGFDGGTGEG